MKIALARYVLLCCVASSALAAPVTYRIDPGHTYPSFEADHFGGLSIWRGKFDESSGSIVLDKDQATGTVEVKVATTSIDFGNSKLNEHARSAEIFDAEKYPTAVYKGTLAEFKNGVPTKVVGDFTLHGVTHPLTLIINQFRCMTNPMSKKEVCGADAAGEFNRSDYGVNFGQKMGFNMTVKLAIQVEASPAT